MKRMLAGLCGLALLLWAGCAGVQQKQQASQPPQEPVDLIVPTLDADGFQQISVTLERQPQELIDALTEQQALPQGVEVLSFAMEGQKLRLDLNADYGEAVRSMGTAGEQMLLGSVVLTFLQAYEAQSLTLTVEGETLETGHNIYDYPLTAEDFSGF